jgi:radical SAM protein with 4Fe4S-binding SPASM domain
MDAKIQARVYSAAKVSLEDVVPLRTPFSAHIDICSVCNYKCSFCFQNDRVGMKQANINWGRMEYSIFKKIVDGLTEFDSKLKKIKIGNHGEPTLHPQLPQMVSYLRDCEVAETIELFTNGSKLNPDLNRRLVDAGLQRINISVEGLSAEAYKQVAGVTVDFPDFVANIKDLYDRRNQLCIYVKVVDGAEIRGKKGEVINLSEKDREFFFETFGPISDEIFVENVVPQWAETHQKALTDIGMYGQKIHGYKKVCPFPFMYLHFNSDGTVAGCTLDWARKVLIGDVRKEEIQDIWNGEILRKLQITMLEGKRSEIPFCGSCDAPMVCCNENLDPFADILLEKIASRNLKRSEY